jgi:hypothetical protein
LLRRIDSAAKGLAVNDPKDFDPLADALGVTLGA